MGIIFPSTILSYLVLFLKPSFQPLIPNLGVTVDSDFSLRYLELNHLVGKLCRLFFFWRLSYLLLYYQDLHSNFASYLKNWQWLLGLAVPLVPSTPLCLYNTISLGNVKDCSKPFSGCSFACQLSKYSLIQHLGPWEILTCISTLNLFCLLMITECSIQTRFSVTWPVLSFRFCYF